MTHVSAINMLPIATTGSNGPVRRLDQVDEREGVPVTEFRAVMDGYFAAMGMQLLAGRAIDDRDRERAPPVVVINETVASRLWPNRKPAAMVGQQVRLSVPEQAAKWWASPPTFDRGGPTPVLRPGDVRLIPAVPVADHELRSASGRRSLGADGPRFAPSSAR